MDRRLDNDELVIIDDFQLVRSVVEMYEYPRRCLLDAMMTALLDRADREGKKILFGTDLDGGLPSIRARARVWTVGDFGASDYEAICRQYLCAVAADRLDFTRIHRFAPMLDLWQLRNACVSLAALDDLNTDKFVDYLGEAAATHQGRGLCGSGCCQPGTDGSGSAFGH